MDSVILASFTTHARGIKFYDVDPRTLRPGMRAILRRQPSRFDANAIGIDLLLPSRRFAFLGHLDKKAACLVSKVLSNPRWETKA